MEWIPFVIVLVLLALNMQVAFAIAIASLSFFLMTTGIPTEIFIQRLMSVTHSFPLLAVPFFILAGVIMNHSGITRRLMALADAFTGHMIGGLAQVNILLSTMMGGMSGSANADAAMQSKILVPEMRRMGYEAPFSAAVTATSSIISVIIPPGIGLIIFGYLGDVSIGRLFVAGIIPGIVLCAGLMVTAGIISRIRGFRPARAERATWPERGWAVLHAFWALLMPIGIIGGIRLGFFTPTEAGAAAVIYAVVIGLAYRDLRISAVPGILIETVMATSVVMLVICAASSLGFYMSWHQIPVKISESLLAITENPYLLLLLINLLLLGVGMFIEGSAGLILLTPMLVPAALSVGIDPVHFGIVVVLNLTIAGVTPPLGTLMFVTCSITGVSIGEFSRAVLPFLAVIAAVLLLLSFVPMLSLALPNLVFGTQ